MDPEAIKPSERKRPQWKRPSAVVGVVIVAVLCLIVGLVAGLRLNRSEEAESPLSAVDIGFAQDMSVHHEQAILLARTLPPDVDPRVRGFADGMALAQTAEIAQLRGWLLLFELPLTAAEPMHWMGKEHEAHATNGAPMPGMASIDEIGKLGGLRGKEAEILFLQLMIRHHQGGLQMAEAAFNGTDTAPVKRVALEMVNGQGNEIGLMTALLTARQAVPLPFP